MKIDEIQTTEIVSEEDVEVETLPIKTETAVINWTEAATVAKRNRIVRQEIIKDVLKPGIDFGEPFGGASKNVLLKPGAEKITDAFELYTDFDILDQIEDFNPTSPMFYYKFKCSLKLRGTDSIMATGIGSCNIRESKYWWREEKPKCPMCECDTVYYDGKKDSYYCWSKKGGCGYNFPKDSKSYNEFKKQKTGRIQNPDMFDQVNTVLKMAKKRSHVDAVLNFGFSDKFTQDLEEFGNGIKRKEEMSLELPSCPTCKKNTLKDYKGNNGLNIYCVKGSGGCGAKFKTLEDIKNPAGNRIAETVKNISEAEIKFKQHGKGDEYKKILDTAKVDHADQITDEKMATEILLKLATKYKSFDKGEVNLPV